MAEEPKTLIPPALEGVDYSEIKVGQQTPIANFWQWVEPWLRDLNVDDLNHLRKKMKVFLLVQGWTIKKSSSQKQ